MVFLMNPYEQKLRDEVIYLHSLWHRGPPTQNPNRPRHIHGSSYLSRNLHVTNPADFKRTNKEKHRNRHAKNKNNVQSGPGTYQQPDPSPEWPVNSPPPSPSSFGSGWPALKANRNSSIPPASDVDRAKIAATQMQQKVIKSCIQFFTNRVDIDSDEDEVEDGEDHFNGNNNVKESEEFKFFFNQFVGNHELRDFYERNEYTGGFYCLVCCGIGEKVRKEFHGCVSLVQHAISISKTKRKRAHRAFGQVISTVLGWDFDRLPMIVLKGEPLGRSLATSGQTQNCLKEGESNKLVKDIDNGVSGTEARRDGDMQFENFLEEDDDKKANEDHDSVVANIGANNERAIDLANLEEEDGAGAEANDILEGNSAADCQKEDGFDQR